MKNKKWKRKAKKIKGICFTRACIENDNKCPYIPNCYDCYGAYQLPKYPVTIDIRELEQLCKGGSI